MLILILLPLVAAVVLAANKAAANICNTPLEVGKCRASYIRYGYDSSIGACRRFTFGGCKAKANNFRTRKKCKKATSKCKRRVRHLHLTAPFVSSTKNAKGLHNKFPAGKNKAAADSAKRRADM
ncbi:inhibitor [Sparganum proliferum]